MPKNYNINELMLLDSQRSLGRLKKGDFITVGGEVLSQAKEILTRNKIKFVALPASFGAYLITIN